MSCGNCGRQNPPGALYCLDCGQKLRDAGAAGPGPVPAPAGGPFPVVAPEVAPVVAASASDRCPRCGVDNPPGLKFCRMCGLSLARDDGGVLVPGGAPVHAPGHGQGHGPPLAPSPAQVPQSQGTAPPRSAPATTPCPRCGSPVDRGASFCGVCGLPAADAKPAPAPVTVGPPSAPAPPASPVAVVAVAPAVIASPAPHAAQHTPAAPLNVVASPVVSGGDAPAPAGRPETRTDNFGAHPVQSTPQLVTILKDGSEGPAYRLTNAVTDVGRYEGNITLPDDPYLSPRHARVIRRNERHYIRDLGSVNGIFYRIREPVELHHGDVVLLGQQVLRVEVLSDAETSLGPVMHYGVMLFGTPEQPRLVRLVQLTSEGIPRDVYHLYREETVVGRESGDVVFTDDVFLSRRHAAFRLERQQRRVVVRDLGSSNGTLVQFRGEREVVDGDLFRIGHHLFRFDATARGGNGASSR